MPVVPRIDSPPRMPSRGFQVLRAISSPWSTATVTSTSTSVRLASVSVSVSVSVPVPVPVSVGWAVSFDACRAATRVR